MHAYIKNDTGIVNMIGPGRNKNGNHGKGRPGSENLGLLNLNRVCKYYQTPAGKFVALNGVSLHIPAGDFISVVGKSGSGKSTLINMITGIDKPSSGEVVVNGTLVHSLSEEQIVVWRGKNIGVIFQFFQLIPTLTSIENIILAMDYGQQWASSQRPERAMQLLELVEMGDLAHKFPAELSGGQQQAVAIARGLANDPPILTADEPTGNLDSKSAALVMGLFESLVESGKTIVMVTHDPEMAERATHKITLADGKIVDEAYKNR